MDPSIAVTLTDHTCRCSLQRRIGFVRVHQSYELGQRALGGGAIGAGAAIGGLVGGRHDAAIGALTGRALGAVGGAVTTPPAYYSPPPVYSPHY